MVRLISSVELKKLNEDSKIAFWGEGYIAAKTFEKTGVIPFFMLDNNPDITGEKQFGVTIKKPSQDNIFACDAILITSTSIKEIADQIKQTGYDPAKIFVTPVLKNVYEIQIFENQSFNLLFSSGLQTDLGIQKIGGGGLYRIEGSFDEFELKKILNGSTHGIIIKENSIICVNEKLGICILDKNLNLVENHIIPKGFRAHGIDFCENTKKWVLACAHLDGILILDEKFKPYKEVIFSNQKSFYDNIAQHHCNDVCVLNKQAYVSMFSLTGAYKRGIYDGGVLIFDLETGEKIDSLYGNLLMPHNIIFKENHFWILDSLRGKVLQGNQNEITILPSFTRGFEILQNGNLLIGQSKNRNFSLLKNDKKHISLDTSIVVHDRKTSISKSLHLPSSVSEIHSIVDINKIQ